MELGPEFASFQLVPEFRSFRATTEYGLPDKASSKDSAAHTPEGCYRESLASAPSFAKRARASSFACPDAVAKADCGCDKADATPPGSGTRARCPAPEPAPEPQPLGWLPPGFPQWPLATSDSREWRSPPAPTGHPARSAPEVRTPELWTRSPEHEPAPSSRGHGRAQGGLWTSRGEQRTAAAEESPSDKSGWSPSNWDLSDLWSRAMTRTPRTSAERTPSASSSSSAEASASSSTYASSGSSARRFVRSRRANRSSWASLWPSCQAQPNVQHEFRVDLADAKPAAARY